jgi:phage tail tape-measure protein
MHLDCSVHVSNPPLLGALVGALVGDLTGAFVGVLVGALVGALVGDLTGALVGAFVGALVGGQLSPVVGMVQIHSFPAGLPEHEKVLVVVAAQLPPNEALESEFVQAPPSAMTK